jgi:winged helix-turn-helix protein
MALDEAKLQTCMGQFVNDLGAVMHAATVVVGDQLGLYKALTKAPATAEVLAQKTGPDARYIREWLSAQCASRYVQFDPETQQFTRPTRLHAHTRRHHQRRLRPLWPSH